MHFICCLSLKVFTTTRSFNVCLKNVNKLDIYSHHTMFHIYCNLYGKCITILTVAATLQKVIWICSNYSCRYFAASTLQQLHCSNLAGGSKNEVAASWLRQPSGNHLQQGCQTNTPIPEKTGSCMQARLNSPRGKFEATWRASKKGKSKWSSLLRTFLAPVLVQNK